MSIAPSALSRTCNRFRRSTRPRVSALPMTGAERVVVHDYSGHPFQVQLSRWLAGEGIETLHLHCPSFSTPKGALDKGDDDPDEFAVEGVRLRRDFAKYSAARRFLQELEYAVRLSRRVGAAKPDVVLSCNTPLLAALVFHAWAKLRRVPVVFWQQDIYSVAMADHVRRKLPVVGGLLGRALLRTERWLARSSRAVVTISDEFVPTLRAWGVPEDRIHVVENWAPLGDLPVRPRDNAFAVEHELVGKTVLLYAGTLGLKHDPSLLLRVATHFGDRDDVKVVVASEGPGADWLRERKGDLRTLELLPFQPFDVLPDMLASADALVTILEPEAGIFSVPSKVLTYHCAGRPILGAVPPDNLAAKIIERERSGLCVAPGDGDALVAAAEQLVSSADLRAEMGGNARSYAEMAFDIDEIGKRIWEVLFQTIDTSEAPAAPGQAKTTNEVFSG